jgi:hypothetical protein
MLAILHRLQKIVKAFRTMEYLGGAGARAWMQAVENVWNIFFSVIVLAVSAHKPQGQQNKQQDSQGHPDAQ